MVGPVCHNQAVATAVGLLNREMYSEAESARLHNLSQSTLHYWLEGGQRRGVDYQPVLRRSATGRRVLTWGLVRPGSMRQLTTSCCCSHQDKPFSIELSSSTVMRGDGDRTPIRHHQS